MLQSEVDQAANDAVAIHILSTLWNEAIAVQGPCKRPGDDAIIVCNLIRLIAGLP